MNPGPEATNGRQSMAKVPLNRGGLLDLPTPPLDRRTGHAENVRRLVNRQSADMLHASDRHRCPRSAETLALRSRSRQPCQHSFSNASLLELGQCGQNMELQLSRRRRAVNALAERDERDAERL